MNANEIGATSPQEENRRLLWRFGCASFLVLASFIIYLDAASSTLSFWPIRTLVFLIGEYFLAYGFLLATVFFFLGSLICSEKHPDSSRPLLWFLLFGTLNSAHLAGSWEWGLNYHGYLQTVQATVFSTAGWLALIALWTIIRGRRSKSFGSALVLQTTFFCWFGYFAFPDLAQPL